MCLFGKTVVPEKNWSHIFLAVFAGYKHSDRTRNSWYDHQTAMGTPAPFLGSVISHLRFGRF